MEASGGADMVGEPKTCRRLLPWRAAPAACGVVLLAPRVGDGQGAQPLLLFPSFQTGAYLSEEHKVRRVGGHHRAPRRALVREREGVRLVKILQHLGVVLHRRTGPQLDCVTLKLDRHAHLAAGIGATHILGAALHTPHRRRGTETGQAGPGSRPEPQPMTPLVKRGSLHHTGRPPEVGVCGRRALWWQAYLLYGLNAS